MGKKIQSSSAMQEKTMMQLKGFMTTSKTHAWVQDKISLLPGQDWENEIRKAIKNSQYFIALLSQISVSKRGFVQSEFRFALDVVKLIPEGNIFVIPARLNDCEIRYEELKKYQYVDMFPEWNNGFEKILRTMKVEVPQNESQITERLKKLVQAKYQKLVSNANRQ